MQQLHLANKPYTDISGVVLEPVQDLVGEGGSLRLSKIRFPVASNHSPVTREAKQNGGRFEHSKDIINAIG